MDAAVRDESASASVRVLNVSNDRATSWPSALRTIAQPKGLDAVPRRVTCTAYSSSRSGMICPQLLMPASRGEDSVQKECAAQCLARKGLGTIPRALPTATKAGPC